MTITLVSREMIVLQVKARNYDWFLKCNYFSGKRISHGVVGTAEYNNWVARIYHENGTKPQLTLEEYLEDEVEASVEELDISNSGDGSQCRRTMHFIPYNLYVTMLGTYSSWDSPKWDDVFFSEPYTFTETRFKPVDISEIEACQ